MPYILEQQARINLASQKAEFNRIRKAYPFVIAINRETDHRLIIDMLFLDNENQVCFKSKNGDTIRAINSDMTWFKTADEAMKFINKKSENPRTNSIF